jgi:hypothetical protein
MKKDWTKVTREEVLAELERRDNSPLLCQRSYDLPISFGEYRRLKSAR